MKGRKYAPDASMVDWFAVQCLKEGVRMNPQFLNEDTRNAAIIALQDRHTGADLAQRLGMQERQVTRIIKAAKETP